MQVPNYLICFGKSLDIYKTLRQYEHLLFIYFVYEKCYYTVEPKLVSSMNLHQEDLAVFRPLNCCTVVCTGFQRTVTSLLFFLRQSKVRLCGFCLRCSSSWRITAWEAVPGLRTSFFRRSRSSAFSSSALSSSCLRVRSAPNNAHTSDTTRDSWPWEQNLIWCYKKHLQ